MKEMPERIYLFDYNDAMMTPLEGDTEYIRKDIVDEMIKTAEDHAFFAGSEYAREEVIEEVLKWLRNNYRNYMHNPTGEKLEAFFGGDMITDLEKELEEHA